MSKLMKKVVAIAMAITLVLPGLTAFANDRHVFPEHFFPNGGYDYNYRWEDEEGSLTIVRAAGPVVGEHDEPGASITSPPHQRIPGVPVRIEQRQLAPDVEPTAANLSNPAWILANTVPVENGVPRYGVTDSNGEVRFDGLALGIWLVQELEELTVTQAMIENGGVNLPAVGTEITNPVPDQDERFVDFLVAIPNYRPAISATPAIPCTDDSHPDYGDVDCEDIPANPGREQDWIFDVRVYPKNEFPVYENEKLLTNVVGNVATWTLTHQIPHGVANIPMMNDSSTLARFGVVDIMSPGLTFVEDSVVGRFEAAHGGWRDLVEGVHFIVHDVNDNIPNSVDDYGVINVPAGWSAVHIQFTNAGIDYLSEHGLEVDGNVEFTLDTTIDRPGRHENRAIWWVNVIPPYEPVYCPEEIEDPENPGYYIPNPDYPECLDEYDPPGDSDWLYTFILELLKVNQADQGLAGAEFGIYHEVDLEDELTDTELAAFEYDGTLPARIHAVETEDGTVFLTPSLNASGEPVQGTTDANGITRFTNADPTALASGSGDGTDPDYQIHNLWIREINPPAGYRILQEFMPITIAADTARRNADEDGNTNDTCAAFTVPTADGTLEIPCHDSGEFFFIVDVEVLNVPAGGWVLPDTGGMGTVVLTVAGIGLVGGALFMFISGKKEDDDELDLDLV